MITPTVGRVCLYVETAEETWPKVEGQPFAAIVCAVLPSGNVNLTLFDAEGNLHTKLDTSFTEDQQPGHPFWMDYQKGQAAKYEALESKLADSQSAPVHVLGKPVPPSDVDLSVTQPVQARNTEPKRESPAETQTAGQDPPAQAGSAATEKSGKDVS